MREKYTSGTKPEDVFELFCQAPPQPPFVMDDPVVWGIKCKEGWMNTGCAGSSVGTQIDRDLIQVVNGCFSDDEEYGHTNIFATCCRVTTASN